MKRRSCDSNCAPEPSIPCTNRTGCWPKDFALAPGAAISSPSAAAATATKRIADVPMGDLIICLLQIPDDRCGPGFYQPRYPRVKTQPSPCLKAAAAI